jgi:hypothetical protein
VQKKTQSRAFCSGKRDITRECPVFEETVVIWNKTPYHAPISAYVAFQATIPRDSVGILGDVFSTSTTSDGGRPRS